MARIRKITWASIVLVLAVLALPFSAFAAPVGFSTFHMNCGSERGEPTANCVANCPMLAQINPRSRQELPPRTSASQPPSCPCRSASQPNIQGTITQSMVGLNGRVSGSRRIYPKNVLDHPQRKEVYNLVVANPGIDLGRIGKTLDLNRETLRYHINLLTSANKIVVMKDHGIIRYYENHRRYGILERRILAHFWNPIAEQILSITRSNPGITQRDIAIRLSLASPTVHWYMQRFIIDGIVKTQRIGRLTHYSITGDAFQVLSNPINPIGVRQSVQAAAFAQ